MPSDLHPISGCDQRHPEADVVFVHGLGGDPFLTWRSGADKASSWPHWLGSEFPQVSVWSIGYPASPSNRIQVLGWFFDRFRDAGHAMALPDRAAQLLNRMVQYGIGQRPLMFICHSLGGLVAKEILRASYDDVSGARIIFSSTRAVLFLSTPHTGSDLASLFSRFRTIFGPTIALKDLRAHDARLRNLLDWYRNHAHPPAVKTTTYYEGRTLKGVRIVDPSSSHPGVGDNPIALDEDHLSIAKPRQPNDQVCVAARDLLCGYVLAIPVRPSPPQPIPPPPDPTPVPDFRLWKIVAAVAVMLAVGIGSWAIYSHSSRHLQEKVNNLLFASSGNSTKQGAPAQAVPEPKPPICPSGNPPARDPKDVRVYLICPVHQDEELKAEMFGVAQGTVSPDTQNHFGEVSDVIPVSTTVCAYRDLVGNYFITAKDIKICAKK